MADKDSLARVVSVGFGLNDLAGDLVAENPGGLFDRYHSITSVPQMPLARTLTKISPGPIFGIGICSRLISLLL